MRLSRLKPHIHGQKMEFYYMINYSFKYLEFLDTVFLALKKKPLRALGPPAARYILSIPMCHQISSMFTTIPRLLCSVIFN